MSTLDNKDFGLKIYNRFPPRYREDDISQSYALKRYLESLSDGGFSHIIDDANGLLSLVNPNTIDAELLPILYEQFGLDLFNGIPENYLRYLLPKLGYAWTQKGSLTIVEFITSSLSGVKVSSELTYDSNGNPYLTVFLEMDYNLGDYFPDVEHFIRLMEKFLPFYVDKSIIYIYTFYDEIFLKVLEESLMVIKYLIEEETNIKSQKTISGIDTDIHKDLIKTIYDSRVRISNELSDVFFDNIKTLLMEDLIRVRPTEMLLTENILLSYDEVAGIFIRGRRIETNAVFAEATFGKSIFANADDFSDVTEDRVFYQVEEKGSFDTNTVGDVCFDTITVNGKTTVIFN